MIISGIDKGVMQLDDLITQLNSIKEQVVDGGSFKVSVNDMLIYDFEDNIELDFDNQCINFKDGLSYEE